ncbi:MAG TPA: sulfotransferase [Pirellulaceae bacterium]|nr:sulfotransferase [Pirellulaceae bacterium]HMO91243.1 sulfotransferase [Pirellulaceae bacterium]HMP68573.1 sulfotransferase [Pirellulaceae bacterium]
MLLSHPYEDSVLLLITGQGRSGTTVMTKAIAEHPQVASNRVESNVIHDLISVAMQQLTNPSRTKQMLVQPNEFRRIFRQMILHLQFPIGHSVLPHTPRPAFFSTFSAMTPSIAELATEIFPGIRFVNIVRNGIEVVSSRMRHRVMQAYSFEEQCYAWEAARQMIDWGANRADFVLVRHEWLLDDAECRRAFETICRVCGLEPSPVCADYVHHTHRNQTSFDEEPDSHKKCLNQRSARWRYWTDAQRQTFIDICGPNMQYLGYEIPWASST